jgi:hypothetical protein
MPYVGFEPTIPASERAKTVYALDYSATVTGAFNDIYCNLIQDSRGLLVFLLRYVTASPQTVS